MRLPLELSVLLLAGGFFALAQQSCNPANDQVNTLTLDFASDCNATQFCLAEQGATSGTCTNRTCRRDEFPFGWGNQTALPPRCGSEKYCPDRGDGCQPKVPLNGTCEMDRDDACAPPLDPTVRLQLADTTNVDGAICLNQRCTYAAAGQGQACKSASIVFTGYADDGTAYSDVVTRDDCFKGLYCDPTSLTCVARLPARAPCTSDRSCQSSTCLATGVCATAPKAHRSTPAGVTAVCTLITLALLGALIWQLLKRGKRRRDLQRLERKRVWEEQKLLRIQMLEVERQERKERGWSWAGESQETLCEKW
ncbi:hypothetical protein JCM10213_005191 [Rhodosporidiobolus nylandii]